MTVFLALARVILPYAGIQNDEALFAVPIYSDVAHEFKMRAFHHDVPLMLMTYLGTAKTWLYGLIFWLWRPGVLSLRVPVVLMGGLTVGLLYTLLRRIAGRPTAFAVGILLATDVSYILSTTFDWGPVAIQHLCWVSGILLVVVGFDKKSAWWFGAGFLMFGIGIWDKALFIWMFSGTGIAGLILFQPEIRARLTLRNVAAAVVGLVVGACPLIIYNLRNPLKTFQSNTVFSSEGFYIKAVVAKRTLAGSALFGYLAREEMTEAPKLPRTAVEKASVALREFAGTRRESLLGYAFVASALAVPLWWTRRRLVLFALMVLMVAWVQMLFTENAGAGVHHVVLLWPLPHIVIGAALAGGAARLRRFSNVALVPAVGVLCLSSLLVYNQYLCQFIRNGSTNIWTDAIVPLSDALTPWQDHHLFTADWGMDSVLKMLHKGAFPRLWTADDVVGHELSPADRQAVARMLELPGALFITHTPSYEIEAGTSKRLFTTADALGYRRQLRARIEDSNGRPVFEISEFTR